MASKKKESEGISLLSMYNDDLLSMYNDEDEEMAEDEKEEIGNTDRAVSKSTPPSLDPSQPSSPLEDSSDPAPKTTPNPMQLSPPPPPQPSVLESQKMTRQALTIVDYAHDETALSPEAEEGEFPSTGHVMFGGDLQTAHGNPQEKLLRCLQLLAPNTDAMIPKPYEQPDPSQSNNTTTRNCFKMDSESAGIEECLKGEAETKDVDPLEEFLLPPPKTKCSEELQERINKFLALKEAGKSFNAEVRNRKDYRNPDFLLHAVSYQDIDEIGSCFTRAVFDPHGYAKSDFYIEIESDMKRKMEKEQEKKKTQKADFVAGMLSGTSKTGMQIPVVSTIDASGHHSLPTTIDAMLQYSRASKKSKWDKVDCDHKNPLRSGGQGVISAPATHAVFLSAANAGAGYTAFAQQKRRDAEEKRSSDKRRCS